MQWTVDGRNEGGAFVAAGSAVSRVAGCQGRPAENLDDAVVFGLVVGGDMGPCERGGGFGVGLGFRGGRDGAGGGVRAGGVVAAPPATDEEENGDR